MKQDYKKQKIVIRYWMLGRGYYLALKAMEFAEKFHKGTRKDGQPEFSHQVSQANYVRTIIDSIDDPEIVLCVIFLHDVMEDYNVSYEEILELFGVKVADATRKMTKVFRGEKMTNEIYYKGIEECPITSVAKGVDRLHNLMTMVGGFKPEKQQSYLKETLDFVVPMLKKARRDFPSQEPAYENIKYVMTNQVILYKELLKIK